MGEIDQAISNANFVDRMKDRADTLGMISRLSGRYISFYADDLAEMLIDDLLEDTAEELDKIERVTRKIYAGEEAKTMAEDALLMMQVIEKEMFEVEEKWKQDKVLRSLQGRPDFEMPEFKIERVGPYLNPFTDALEKEGVSTAPVLNERKAERGMTIEID